MGAATAELGPVLVADDAEGAEDAAGVGHRRAIETKVEYCGATVDGTLLSGVASAGFATQFLADDSPQCAFQVFAFLRLPQGLVNQGLIAALAGLRFEILDDGGIQRDRDSLLAGSRLKSYAECRTVQIRLYYFGILIPIVRGW